MCSLKSNCFGLCWKVYWNVFSACSLLSFSICAYCLKYLFIYQAACFYSAWGHFNFFLMLCIALQDLVVCYFWWSGTQFNSRPFYQYQSKYSRNYFYHVVMWAGQSQFMPRLLLTCFAWLFHVLLRIITLCMVSQLIPRTSFQAWVVG